MIEIPAHYHQPFARLLVAIVVGAAVAFLLLRRMRAPDRRRRLMRAAAAGILCAVLSAVLYSSRGAGTGTQTAWGWPRTVFSLWQSWETGQRSHGIDWRGVIENALFYGALAAVIGALRARSRSVAA